VPLPSTTSPSASRRRSGGAGPGPRSSRCRPLYRLSSTSTRHSEPTPENELAAYYRGIAPSLKPKRDELAKVEKSKNDLVRVAQKDVATEAMKEPRTIRIFPAGNCSTTAPIVEPAVPAFLGKGDVSGRRANRP